MDDRSSCNIHCKYNSYNSAPVLYCLFIASEQSINLNISVVDILRLPFQIRTGLYPIILVLILEAIAYRTDVLLVFGAGLLYELTNIKKVLIWVGKIGH